jgi:hypothetical protein
MEMLQLLSNVYYCRRVLLTADLNNPSAALWTVVLAELCIKYSTITLLLNVLGYRINYAERSRLIRSGVFGDWLVFL